MAFFATGTCLVLGLLSSFAGQALGFRAGSLQLHAVPAVPRCRDSSLRLSAPTDEGLQRSKRQLDRMQGRQAEDEVDIDPRYQKLYREYIQQPANALKVELRKRKLENSGRKPDLAKRLAENDIGTMIQQAASKDEEVVPWIAADGSQQSSLSVFCSMVLSEAAGKALGSASFNKPSPIQAKAIPRLVNGESLVLHAETGSGKTLAYLLPITEQLWDDFVQGVPNTGYGFILTPTRELAAQVAGIASVLAPPGSVRMVSQPTNLMSKGRMLRERGDDAVRGLNNDSETSYSQTAECRLFVGSAKAIMASLYGSNKMPASPTRKPEAMYMLQSTRWLVLDEVDRLLNLKTKGDSAISAAKQHEKPAAILTSAVTRMTLGKAQIIAASATVGRPLKRELSRVLGLAPKDCPEVVHGTNYEEFQQQIKPGEHHGRAITIPETVENYAISVDGESVGNLLTSAYFVVKGLNEKPGRKMLLVLTKRCGINTRNAVGALQHFRCKPEPQSLLDALEAEGTDHMIQKHRAVSGAAGVGQSYFQGKGDTDDGGYLFVTGEDTIRGLHLDGLDAVIIVGRANGPDEYTHIAGRTGRAGRRGTAISVVSQNDAETVDKWSKLLDVDFRPLDLKDVKDLL